MPDHDVLHSRDVRTPVAAMKAALAQARIFAPREVRFTDGGIVAVDVLGVEHALTRNGAPAPLPLPDVREALNSYGLRSHSRSRDEDSERDFREEGTWVLGKGDDGTVVLKPKKAFPFCLDQLMDADPDALARLRAAYRIPDVRIDVACEGEARTRDVAATIAAERAMVGCPTGLALQVPAEHRHGRSYGEDQVPVPPFDAMTGAGYWSVAHIEPRNPWSDENPAPVEANVKVREERNASYMAGRMVDAMAKVEGNAVAIRVYLEKSRPIAVIAFSPALAGMLDVGAGFRDTPWDLHAERQAARSGRVRPPKTWHQTTEAVAEAFVARNAPRGFVSGDSLTFHGPVAFSAFRTNPIAAIVDAPDGVPTIFLGRNDTVGGGTAAIVSMAQQDVVRAAGDRFRIVDVECLKGLLTLGDRPLDTLPHVFRAAKNEADYPAGCTLDAKGIAAWLANAWEKAEAEVEESHRTTFPTGRQSLAFSRLAHLVDRRDLLATVFAVDLPDMGESGEFRARARAVSVAADARQRELEDRRRAKAAGPVPEPVEPEPEDEDDEDEPDHAPGI